MNISIFEGPISNTSLSSKLTSWPSFIKQLSQPTIGKKDGSYFTRGYCNGSRMDKNMQSLDFIIIDGDRSLSNPASCCSPLVAHKVMVAEGITHIIYTSHSHDPANNILKWRLLVPCKYLTEDNLVRGTADIIDVLQKGGAAVKSVKENTTLSQGWFFPRYPADRKKDFIFKKYIGTTYRISVESTLVSSKKKKGKNLICLKSTLNSFLKNKKENTKRLTAPRLTGKKFLRLLNQVLRIWALRQRQGG